MNQGENKWFAPSFKPEIREYHKDTLLPSCEFFAIDLYDEHCGSEDFEISTPKLMIPSTDID